MLKIYISIHCARPFLPESRIAKAFRRVDNIHEWCIRRGRRCVQSSNIKNTHVGSEDEGENSEETDDQILPDDPISAAEISPEGDDFNDAGTDETEDGKAEGSDDSDEGTDGWNNNGQNNCKTSFTITTIRV